jgi:hypothetical protein
VYVNGKMKSVKTIPGIGEGENDGWGKFNYDVLAIL